MKIAQPRVSRPNWYDTRPFADLPRAHPSQMQMLFDLLPVVFFFIAYKLFDIYVATGVAIAATFVQVAIAWYRTRQVATMQLVTLAIIIIFGGLKAMGLGRVSEEDETMGLDISEHMTPTYPEFVSGGIKGY